MYMAMLFTHIVPHIFFFFIDCVLFCWYITMQFTTNPPPSCVTKILSTMANIEGINHPLIQLKYYFTVSINITVEGYC